MTQKNKPIQCSPSEAALKGMFLGPQAENGPWVSKQVDLILQSWYKWRQSIYPQDGHAISEKDLEQQEFKKRQADAHELVLALLERFQTELPKFSPRYIGHMFSEISLPAFLGHIISLIHNPNNISGEASRVGLQIEEEAIQFLCKMIGYDTNAVGHFTSGGTIANFEGVFRALERTNQWLHLASLSNSLNIESFTFKEACYLGYEKASLLRHHADIQTALKTTHSQWSNPYSRAKLIEKYFNVEYSGRIILVPNHKHYSWVKAAALFGIGEESLWLIHLDHKGHLDLAHMEELIEKALAEHRPISLCVSVAGTTELGNIDPCHKITSFLENQKQQGVRIWHHIDAAYGGFLTTLKDSTYLSKETQLALKAFSKSDSVTLDPHKLGYVPYSSGAFLCQTATHYYQRSFTGPYLQATNSREKGPFTLEGSRSSAGAVSTWLTAKAIGLNEAGYGKILERTIISKVKLEQHLTTSIPQIKILPYTEANILGIVVSDPGDSFSQMKNKTQKLYEKLSSPEQKSFFISRTTLTLFSYSKYLQSLKEQWQAPGEIEDLPVIRICVMNPFFDSKELSIDYKEAFTQLIKQLISDDF